MRTPIVAAVLSTLIAGLVLSCTSSPTPASKSPTTAAPASPPKSALTSTTSSAAKPVSSPQPAVSFAGKTITLVVPFAPGGSTDVVGRLWGLYLPRFMPGRPSVIVRNLPGGAGILGVNYAYSSKPDGLTALIGTASRQVDQLIGLGSVRYDFLKMRTIVIAASGGFFYMASGIVARPEDLTKAKGIVFGLSSGLSYLAVPVKEVLNFPTQKFILAYSGAGDSQRAFLTGESNMTYMGTAGYSEIKPYVDKKEVMLAFQTGLADEKGNIVKETVLPSDLVTIQELYEKMYQKPPAGIAWDALKGVIAIKGYDKGLFLPPGTPDNITSVYWQAADKMVNDPEFKKTADKMVGEGTKWILGAAGEKEFKLNFGMDPKVGEWLKDAMKKYGVVTD